MFSDNEAEYLNGQPLGRLATVTAAGRAHVIPVGFRISDERPRAHDPAAAEGPQ